jgi:hypothetical protein
LSAPAREKIAQVIFDGAMRLSLRTNSNGTDIRNPSRNITHEAGNRLTTLIQKITEATKNIGEESVQAETVDAVMSKICPLWPFCYKERETE